MFRDVDDIHEVHNYVQALDYGLERLKDLPLSIRLIREIHSILMQGVRGELITPGEMRRSQNWIGRPGASLNDARYVPPPPDEMYNCLSNLESFIHADSELPLLLRIGMIHYQFEAIHPFLDGNGRVGRLMVTFLLVAWGLLSQPLLYLSNFIEINRQEYYYRLLAVSQKGSGKRGCCSFWMACVAKPKMPASALPIWKNYVLCIVSSLKKTAAVRHWVYWWTILLDHQSRQFLRRRKA